MRSKTEIRPGSEGETRLKLDQEVRGGARLKLDKEMRGGARLKLDQERREEQD